MSNKKKSTEALSNNTLAYQGVFTSSAGRVVLEHLKKTLRFGENIYAPGMSEMDIAYQLGRQSVINDINFILNKEGK